MICEPDIGPVNGLEVAEYVDTFFPDLPVLLVGSEDLPLPLSDGPNCIIGYEIKENDPEEILRIIEQHVGTQQPAFHFANPARRTGIRFSATA